MKNLNVKYPIIDLFAGPGGLGEGFSSASNESGNPLFNSAISIEHDDFAYKTLHLRHFLRAFENSDFPKEYYKYLKGEYTVGELFKLYPAQKEHADNSAHQISLGPENHDKVKRLITDRLGDKNKWVLVGGPPCQAYSLVGRSRMIGNPEFENDIRHFLYLEYLKIIIDHMPPVFVMENVKGLLSSKVKGEFVIDKILSDLRNPNGALNKSDRSLGYCPSSYDLRLAC